uniref:Uncharacterized protein n=1 Tax=Setaria italica TaxID=4555 RepID=K3ZFW0_SETIT
MLSYLVGLTYNACLVSGFHQNCLTDKKRSRDLLVGSLDIDLLLFLLTYILTVSNYKLIVHNSLLQKLGC